MNQEHYFINTQTYLNVTYTTDRKTLERCDIIEIFLYLHKQKYFLTWDQIEGAFFIWYSALKKILQNKLLLDTSIQYDIGYMWEQYLAIDSLSEQYKPHPNFQFKEKKYKNTTIWVGEQYLIWEPIYKKQQSANLWLYNSNDGKIILEVTPAYKWHFTEPKPHDGFIPFAEFIRNYKPVLKTEISHSQAQQWLNQTEDFLKIVHDNDPFGGFL